MFTFLVLAISIAAFMERQDRKGMDDGYAVNQVDVPLLSKKAKAND